MVYRPLYTKGNVKKQFTFTTDELITALNDYIDNNHWCEMDRDSAGTRVRFDIDENENGTVTLIEETT